MSNDERRLLLDRFPLTEREVDHLLDFHALYYGPGGQSPTFLFSRHANVLPELVQVFQDELNQVRVCYNDDPVLRSQTQFLETAVTLMGRRKTCCSADKIFTSLLAQEQGPQKQDQDRVSVDTLADFLHRLAVFGFALFCGTANGDSQMLFHQSRPQSWARSMAFVCNQDKMTQQEWLHWVQTTAPETCRLLEMVFEYLLLGNSTQTKRQDSFFAWASETTFFRKHAHVPLKLTLMGLGGSCCYRLYSSQDSDGLAFRTLAQALVSYAGPTLTLIQTTEGDMLGYYTTLAWKKGWHNDQEAVSFLFRLVPEWNVYRLSNGDTANTLRIRYHQYLHMPLGSQSNSLAGLAVGGITADTPRLHLTTSLERCKASPMDCSFMSGPLLGNDDSMFFNVEALQVWAISNHANEFQTALRQGQLQTAIGDAMRRRASRVDKRQFVDDFASGAYLNSLYQHRQEMSDRADIYVGQE